jgi:hypothetical protein
MGEAVDAEADGRGERQCESEPDGMWAIEEGRRA